MSALLRQVPVRHLLAAGAGVFFLTAGAGPARAAIPAGYMGKPFDPAVAGGPTIVPPTVKAGPYALPGRVDLVNYDMGGDGVGYKAASHYTTKDGDGYRIDRPAATMCKTLNAKPDVFYGTGTADDGKFYPTATTNDFYIGSIHPDDWFNYTVDVKTAGTYTLSSTFSTGNGPPGGEGGDGQMEVIVFVNGTKAADWKATFPDFGNTANFHNWKPYPNFATVTLEAGIQVIKIQLPFKHLNLDYIQFDLMGGGGAAGSGGNNTGAAGATATTTGAAGAAAGVAGTSGGTAGTTATTTGAAGTTTSTGAAGTSGTTTGAAGTSGATTGAAGTSGGATTGAAGTAPGVTPGKGNSGGCALGGKSPPSLAATGLLVLAAAIARRRKLAQRQKPAQRQTPAQRQRR